MPERIFDQPVDGGSWWKKLLGVNLVGNSQQLADQEIVDARRLISIGIKTNDPEAIRIGKARLRIALGKGDLNDYSVVEDRPS